MRIFALLLLSLAIVAYRSQKPTPALTPEVAGASIGHTSNIIFQSADGGNTWSRVLAGVATEVIASPGSGSVFYSAIHSSGVYKSTDGGVN